MAQIGAALPDPNMAVFHTSDGTSNEAAFSVRVRLRILNQAQRQQRWQAERR